MPLGVRGELGARTELKVEDPFGRWTQVHSEMSYPVHSPGPVESGSVSVVRTLSTRGITMRTRTEPPASTPSRAGIIMSGFGGVVVVFLLGTWLGSGVLLVLQPMTGLSSDLLMLTQFGPSLGVLAVVLTRRILGRTTTVAASLRPTGLVLPRITMGAAVLVMVFGACVGLLALIGQPVHLPGPEQLGTSLWLLAPLQFVDACGEELGWRAFLHEHLHTRWSSTSAALVVGTLWATWHVDYFRFGLVFFGTFWLSCLAISVVLAQLVRGSGRGALLIAGTFHWLINLGTSMVMDFSAGELPQMLVLAGALMAAAVGLTAIAGSDASTGRWVLRNGGSVSRMQAKRTTVPDGVRARVELQRIDHQSAFTVVAAGADERSAQEWARAMYEAPSSGGRSGTAGEP